MKTQKYSVKIKVIGSEWLRFIEFDIIDTCTFRACRFAVKAAKAHLGATQYETLRVVRCFKTS